MLDRIRADCRAMGPLGWFLYLADRGLRLSSGGHVRLWSFRFYAQPVPANRLLAPASGVKWRIGPVSADELPAAAFQRPTGAVEQRFLDGSVCVAAVHGDDLAGFMWLHFGPMRERLLACDFEALPGDRACWDYDFEVMPRYRLGRTFARLWDETFRLLRNRGIEATLSWIAFSNRASQRAHERMGARRVGWLVVLDVFDHKLGVQPAWPIVRFTTRGRRMHVPVHAGSVLGRGTVACPDSAITR